MLETSLQVARDEFVIDETLKVCQYIGNTGNRNILSFDMELEEHIHMKYVYYLLFFTILYSSCFSSKNTEKNYEDLETNQYSFEFRNNTYYGMNDLSYFLPDTSIKSLRFYKGTFSDLSPLAQLQYLEELDITANDSMTDISTISLLLNLKRLTLSLDNIESLEPLSTLVNLKYLLLQFSDDIYFEELLPLQSLETLRISRGVDVIYISQILSLKELYIEPISNIDMLKNLVNLEKLTLIAHYDNNLDLSWIIHLQNLRELHIERYIINDLTPLLELPNLVDLNLLYTRINNIKPLLGSNSLRSIHGYIIDECDYLKRAELYELANEKGIWLSPYTSNR